VEATLTLDLEVIYEKQIYLDKMCKFFFKSTCLQFDDNMIITALKGSVLNFTAIYKDFWIYNV